MTCPPQVLVVEDNPNDAELVVMAQIIWKVLQKT